MWGAAIDMGDLSAQHSAGAAWTTAVCGLFCELRLLGATSAVFLPPVTYYWPQKRGRVGVCRDLASKSKTKGRRKIKMKREESKRKGASSFSLDGGW